MHLAPSGVCGGDDAIPRRENHGDFLSCVNRQAPLLRVGQKFKIDHPVFPARALTGRRLSGMPLLFMGMETLPCTEFGFSLC